MKCNKRIKELESQKKEALKGFASMSDNYEKMKGIAQEYRLCNERMQEREREFNKLPWYKKMTYKF